MAKKNASPALKGRNPYQPVMPIENKVDVGPKALPIRKTEAPIAKIPTPSKMVADGNLKPGKTNTGKIATINKKPKR